MKEIETNQPEQLLKVEPRPFGFWRDPANIETELLTAIAELGHFPTGRELAQTNRAVLGRIMTKTGGRNYWRERMGITNINSLPVDVPRDSQGRISWVTLKEDPDKLRETIEAWGQVIADQGIPLSYAELKRSDNEIFGVALRAHYPGGVVALREKLGKDRITPDQAVVMYKDVLEGKRRNLPPDFWPPTKFDKQNNTFGSPSLDERVSAVIRFAALEASGFSLDHDLGTKMNPRWLADMKLLGLINKLASTRAIFEFAFRDEISENFGQKYISQREGIMRLGDFVTGEIQFEELRPFVLNITPEQTQKKNGHHLYLGKLNGKNIYFSIPKDFLISDLGKVYAVPKAEYGKGEEPIFLLDFYVEPTDESDSRRIPFSSCKLNPNSEFKAIDFQGWHSFGEHLLANYLLGQNGVSFGDVESFYIFVKSKTVLSQYRIDARKEIKLHLAENSLISDGDTLKFVPGQNSQYQWMDVYKVREDLEEKDWQRVSRYILSLDDKDMTSSNYRSLEMQGLLDFLEGKQNDFEKVQPMRTSAVKGGGITIGSIEKEQVVLYYPKSALEIGEEIIIIPKEDEGTPYKWLELYRSDEQGSPTGSLITSARVIGGKIDSRHWSGIEKQLLVDYLKGEMTFLSLRPISLTAGETEVITVFRRSNIKPYIVLSQSFNLSPGDKLMLVPINEEDGQAHFTLFRDRTILANYRYDLTKNTFVNTGEFVGVNEAQGTAVSPILANEQLAKLVEAIK